MTRVRRHRCALLAAAVPWLLAVSSRTAPPAFAAPAARAAPTSPGGLVPPRRVVSLAPSLTELVFALGAGASLVGVTTYCDYPAAARRLPRVGGIEDGSIGLERVVRLRPDLVVAIGEGQADTVEALRRLGLRVEVVECQSIEDVFDSTARMGALLGRQPMAGRLAADLERRMARVGSLIRTVPAARRPRVFYELWDRPLMTATDKTMIGRLIGLAGGINIFGDLAGRYPQVSPEAVLKRDPQLILAPDHHASSVDGRDLAARLGLPDAGAAPRERVLILDGDLVSRAGPRIADALELLARLLHPELFPSRRAAAPGAGGHR